MLELLFVFLFEDYGAIEDMLDNDKPPLDIILLKKRTGSLLQLF